ncbi:MAG: dihydrodipicolinate synthase family protein [Candidatus Pacebacteria bacterium]|nr:dihydrodipicolinate synthase family protein [Candidatus Paceibacterota bacterium]
MFQMKGVIPPMITPFRENGEVDYDALKELVLFLRERVNGLFILGSYGSGAMMSVEERKKTAETVMQAAAGRIPVIVHVGSTNSITSCDLAKHAVSIGADAVSAVGPYYFKHSAEDICLFYSDLVKAVDGKAGLYVYNNPNFQGYPMDLKLITKLKNEIGVTGIKDATFDILTHASYMRLLKDETFDVALGTEAMWLSACVLGCEAFIPGLGNAFPEICGQMYKEGMERQFDKCRETQFTVNEMRDIMYIAKSTQLAIYAMLEIRGIVKAYPRRPFAAAGEKEKTEIKKRIQTLGLM